MFMHGYHSQGGMGSGQVTPQLFSQCSTSVITARRMGEEPARWMSTFMSQHQAKPTLQGLFIFMCDLFPPYTVFSPFFFPGSSCSISHPSYFHILPNLQIFPFLPQVYVVEKLSLVSILEYKDSCIFSSSWPQGLKVNLTALHNQVDKMCSFFVLHKASQDTSCCLTMLLSALQKVTSRTDKAFGRRFVPDPSPSNQLPVAR